VGTATDVVPEAKAALVANLVYAAKAARVVNVVLMENEGRAEKAGLIAVPVDASA
jgi:hypothetical protein